MSEQEQQQCRYCFGIDITKLEQRCQELEAAMKKISTIRDWYDEESYKLNFEMAEKLAKKALGVGT